MYKYLHLLEFGEDNDVAEEEQVSLLGLWALGDLNTLVQQQLSVLTGEAKDEWTLLHRDPAGSLLSDTQKKVGGHRQTSLILVIMLYTGFTTFSRRAFNCVKGDTRSTRKYNLSNI